MTENYVCSLDEKSLKKAKEELNEDPKERISAVNTLKKWVLEQPHLTCPMDPVFLLAFLRARKFSQLEARALLEKFLTMKTKHKEWFDDIDPHSSGIQAILNEGYVFQLAKRNAEGQIVVVCVVEKLKPWIGRFTKIDIFRTYLLMTYDVFLSNETAQVNGVVFVYDFTGMTMKHQTMFSIDEIKSFLGGWHRAIPARMKRVITYNLGLFGDFFMPLIKFTMPEALQDRLVNCGSNLENLYKEIPMDLLPVEYLPDDYKGPNGGPVNGLFEKYRAHLMSPESCARIRQLSSPQFRINESKRDKDVVAASFRKLNVD